MASYDSLRNQISALKEFLSSTRTADPREDANFQRILRDAQNLLVLSDQQLGDQLSVSRPTINRWVNGRNLPYMAMRKPVFAWIEEKVTAKIRTLESLERKYRREEEAAAVASNQRVAMSWQR